LHELVIKLGNLVTKLNVWLSNPAYVLGDSERSYVDLIGLEEKIDEFKMPNFPEIWGWDRYYVNTKAKMDMARDAVSKCLANTISCEAIDHIIFSSSEISETFMASNDRLKLLLSENGLMNKPVSGVSLTGCNNIISAMCLARGLLQGGTVKNILLVSEEDARCETQRFDKHCIFSDAACAFLLSTEIESDFVLADAEVKFSWRDDTVDTFDIFRGNSNDIRNGYVDLLARNSLEERNISCLITPNYYLPILDILLNNVKMPIDKRYRNAGKESSHFFSCDFIINLTDYLNECNNDYLNIVMFAYADMQYGFCLIKKYNSN
jgi:3-oxoacyl-[acyl-carrier-protein] synthase-3